MSSSLSWRRVARGEGEGLETGKDGFFRPAAPGHAIALEEQAGRAAILTKQRMFLADLLERQGALQEELAEAEFAVEKQVEALEPEHSRSRHGDRGTEDVSRAVAATSNIAMKV